jgi:hypothetical protein
LAESIPNSDDSQPYLPLFLDCVAPLGFRTVIVFGKADPP